MKNKQFRIFTAIFGGIIGPLAIIFGIVSKDETLLLTGISFMALYAFYLFRLIASLKNEKTTQKNVDSPLIRRR